MRLEDHALVKFGMHTNENGRSFISDNLELAQSRGISETNNQEIMEFF